MSRVDPCFKKKPLPMLNTSNSFVVVGKVSLQIEKEIRKFTAKKLPRKFRFSLIYDTYDIGNYFKFKEGQALLHYSRVVYKSNCFCGQSNIGQTRHSVITRINDHKQHGKSIKHRTLQSTSY